MGSHLPTLFDILRSMIHQKNHSPHLLAIFLFFYSWIGTFFISEINILLSIFTTLIIFTLSYPHLKNKSHLLLFWAVTLIISISTIKMAIKDNTRNNHCFEFNISYPGTGKYTTCTNSLSLQDYLGEIFRIQ